jgi:ubiquinone/menaquinone biosynthesis C-methylase UbiE
MLDSSLGMLLRARRRVAAAPRRPVALLGDLHHLPHLEGQFDVVVTHFVLDQWQGSELARVVAGLARVLRPGGWWIWSDFACPERGLGRWRARCALPMLYFAFRRIAEIEARALECPAPHLRDCGLERCATESFLAGFVTSEAWRSSGRVSRE